MTINQKRSSIPNIVKLHLIIALVLVCLLVAMQSYILFRKDIISSDVKNVLIYASFSIIALIASIIVLLWKQFKDAYSNLYIKRRQLDNCYIQLDELKKNVHQKTEFFANMSHELKTPLSVILGAIQLLEQNKPAITNERRKSTKNLNIIKQNSYRLLRLINNLLDITRVESGYAKLTLTNCNIVQLVNEITGSVEPYAELRNLSLNFYSEAPELYTAVDVDKIERVILNLLSNAIKFTPKGGHITINTNQDDEYVLISVKDTGVGVPPNMTEKIFERFGQIGSASTREHEGSGIGLSLVKCFVDLHEGSIELISSENVGSEFIIRLPIRNDLESPAQSETVYRKEQKKVIETINIELSDIYSAVS
jgi:signal transduction histidine kinase